MKATRTFFRIFKDCSEFLLSQSIAGLHQLFKVAEVFNTSWVYVTFLKCAEKCAVKKTRFWGNQLHFDFLNLYLEKMTLAKVVACTMIFNTASTMTNWSVNNQNELFSCSEIGLLRGFLVFYPIKINFVKPEACAVVFSTRKKWYLDNSCWH